MLKLCIVVAALGLCACDFGNYGPADGGAQAEPTDSDVALDLSVPDLAIRDMSGAVLTPPDLAVSD
jgi:hypothetical protein